ncbi:[Fe-Fe] hydrogenase large subunit C-terminal domain-containing protein [Labilibacter marinus]|uniref:[Fe-Fe] hydrogenase large subunit C-terminal domain-containing protein n=1 Tax=Labilibacter marinus TaxID=1477105 RepID=UPI00094FAB65|nr:[Fe-Fe] hydrogenase large subunit C-terminal domain-containing protein [Labilibacter marinus]
MNTKPIYTIENDCKDCYKCIRNCPSKAIKITEQKASIIDELCVYCGHCVSICPAEAKQVRDGVSRVKQLINSGTKTVVSLAPSYRTEFKKISDKELISGLTTMGFNYISETALGAQVVTEHTEQFLKARKKGIYISSACPGVVELIKKYYPQNIPNITPFLSPMLTHAKMLKQELGEDTKVVFIGPCIAKKAEADNWPKLIDTAISFKELKDWMQEEDVWSKEKQESQFFPHKANNGKLYPIDGGMINTFSDQSNSKLLNLSFSGINEVKRVLNDLNEINHDGPVFLELLLCEGGCINGPGCTSEANPVQKKIDVLYSNKNEESIQQKTPLINIECDYFGLEPIQESNFSPEEIRETLYSIGKADSTQELNCGSCGYNTCREFAKATLAGMAETNMCVSHLKKIAHNQAAVLLKKIPSGVIIINHEFKVVEMNMSCAKMLGDDIEKAYYETNELKGISINDLGYFKEHFKTAIHTGKEYNQIAINQNGANFQLSIFNIQKHKLITGIIQNFKNKEFKADIIENRTREVIKKNMETVQKIAALLGENASHTDSLLNSILNDHSVDKAIPETHNATVNE